MIRIVLWSIWLSSGLLILILFGGIVTIMLQPPDSALETQPRNDELDLIISVTQRSVIYEDSQEIINIINARKGYSNPKPTSEDEEDAQNIGLLQMKRQKRTRRPLRRIDKDFNPCQSYTFKHPNGTLTYVFPCPDASRKTTPTITTADDRPPSVTERQGSAEPLDTYPAELIDGIMHEHITSFQGAFGNDMINGDELNSRFDISNDDFYCDSEETLIHPSVGLTAKNSTVKIVNTKFYSQGVRIEICRNEGKPCKFCDENTVCKQLYHYRTLVAINTDARKPYKELIKLPSSCKCARIAH